jgi:hypothetical protein
MKYLSVHSFVNYQESTSLKMVTNRYVVPTKKSAAICYSKLRGERIKIFFDHLLLFKNLSYSSCNEFAGINKKDVYIQGLSTIRRKIM